ncbi:LOW QUALITY PROTEIN: hypothetical protein MXB_4343 [Myxobolus squamalis]|nr:LOW QUALITY PROTEIN: hypothetical protein MXB_4343 [Myxobolus squamalis]
MSSDCEALIKKALVFNPQKRATIQSIMQDKWVNIGFENNKLKPYLPQKVTEIDTERIGIMCRMGFDYDEIINSLKNNAYDDVMATYLLLDKEKCFSLASRFLQCDPQHSLTIYLINNQVRNSEKDYSFTPNYNIKYKENEFSPSQQPLIDRNGRDRSKTITTPRTNNPSITENKPPEIPSFFNRLSIRFTGKKPYTSPGDPSDHDRNFAHKPPTRNSNNEPSPDIPKPRSLRFTWSMKTTSSHEPEIMMKEIIRVLNLNNIAYERPGYFTLLCMYTPYCRDEFCLKPQNICLQNCKRI